MNISITSCHSWTSIEHFGYKWNLFSVCFIQEVVIMSSRELYSEINITDCFESYYNRTVQLPHGGCTFQFSTDQNTQTGCLFPRSVRIGEGLPDLGEAIYPQASWLNNLLSSTLTSSCFVCFRVFSIHLKSQRLSPFSVSNTQDKCFDEKRDGTTHGKTPKLWFVMIT